MNEYRSEDMPCCYFHPKEANTVGVCPLCLNERLLILSAKQGSSTHSTARHRVKPSSITLPKIFALGSLLKPHDQQKQFDHTTLTDASSISAEDSFISIKFEGNGVASWEKTKVSLDHCNKLSWNGHTLSKEAKSVVEHGKPHGGSLRWRKRIGHLFQLSRWRRSTKGSTTVCQVIGSSKLEGVKVRSGWIRTLTKRRTKE